MKGLFLSLLLIPLAAAQVYEPIPNLDPASMEYQQYTVCVDQCSTCESQCKDNTLHEAARTKLDPSLCGQLNNDNLKKNCQDNVYTILAFTNKDESYCDKLSDPFAVKGCKASLLNAKAEEAKDASLCPTESCKYSVYTTLAAQNQDPSFCEMIADEFGRINCRNNVQPKTDASGPVSDTDQKKLPAKLILGAVGGIAGLVLLAILTIVLLRKRKGREDTEEEAFKQRFTQLSQIQQPKLNPQQGTVKK